jgi:hypothetical protein
LRFPLLGANYLEASEQFESGSVVAAAVAAVGASTAGLTSAEAAPCVSCAYAAPASERINISPLAIDKSLMKLLLCGLCGKNFAEWNWMEEAFTIYDGNGSEVHNMLTAGTRTRD